MVRTTGAAARSRESELSPVVPEKECEVKPLTPRVPAVRLRETNRRRQPSRPGRIPSLAIENPTPLLAEPAVATRPTWVRYEVLAWACSLSMLTYIDRVCIKEVGGDICKELDLSDQQFSFVLSAFGLSYAIFEMPSGWLGDRFGPRQVLARIVLWWSLFTALTGCVWKFELDSGYTLGLPVLSWLQDLPTEVPLVFNSLVLLVLIRFLFGAGEAGAYPNIARALRNWFPYRRRGLAQGLLWMFGRWGGASAPVLAGGFAALVGWRGAFLLFGAIGVGWVIAFTRFFRNSPAEHPSVNEAERAFILDGRREAELPPPLSWRTMLGSPTLWLLGFMYFCSNAGWCFFITWDKKYYTEVLKLSGAGLSLASAAPLFCGGVACIVGGLFTDRMVRRWGPRWGRTLQGSLAYFLGGTFFALALYAESPWLAVLCLSLASFSKDFAMAVSWATCLDIGHRYSGTVSAFMNMVGNLGTFVAPPLVAYLAGRGKGQGGWHWALIISSSALFCASVCWPFINPRRVVVYQRDV
jgi:MFS family permease